MKTKNNFAALLLLAAGLILFISSVASLPTEDMVTVPDGYEKICSVDMSEARKDAVVYSFRPDTGKQTGIYVWTNMSAEKYVRLTGPGNMQIDLLSGKGNIGQTEVKLEAGEYGIAVTNPADKGEMLIYYKKQP
jgi:hypothetical protein